jgi:site-specific DNA recombinase
VKTVVYSRLSRTRDGSTSIERQEAACRAEADRRGWKVVDVIADEDVSGATDLADRPGGSRLLEMLPNIDAVIVWRVDRIARSTLALATLLKMFEEHRVALVSATEPIETVTPIGRALVTIVGVLADIERHAIAERTQSAKRYLADAGRHVSGRPDYGLLIRPAPDGRGKILVRDPDAAEVIREIADRILDGWPLDRIARDLTARGIPSPRTRTSLRPRAPIAPWGHGAVKRVVTNVSVLGYREDERGNVIRDDDGRPVVWWEPVLDESTYQAVQEAIQARARKHRPPRSRHWLYEVARCGRCGRPLYQNASHSHRRETVLRCYGGRTRQCGGVVIRDDELTTYVEETFLTTVGRLPAVERVLVAGTRDPSAEIEDVEQALRRLRDDRDAGLWDGEEDEYRRRVLALRKRRDVLRAMPVEPPRYELRPLGISFAEHWASLDRHQRGELLRSIGVRVVVHPGQRGKRLDPAERCDFEWPEDGLVGIGD